MNEYLTIDDLKEYFGINAKMACAFCKVGIFTAEQDENKQWRVKKSELEAKLSETYTENLVTGISYSSKELHSESDYSAEWIDWCL